MTGRHPIGTIETEQLRRMAKIASTRDLSEALDLVHQRAETRIGRDPGEAEIEAWTWRREAIDRFGDFLTNNWEDLDDRFDEDFKLALADPVVALGQPSPAAPAVGSELSTMSALAVCLELANTGEMDGRQGWKIKAAIGSAAWLLRTHGATIDAEVTTIDIGPLMKL